MRKLIAVLLSIVALASCITACSEAGNQIDLTSIKLSEEKKEEIQNAWFEVEGHPMGEICEPVRANTIHPLRYYGSYEDYEIIFFAGVADMITTKTIAQMEFKHGSSFVIYAYQNGVFEKLEDVYESGKISADSIKRIAQVHQTIEEL